MFVFNFFMVLLASCIAGSLYSTVADILKSGWCALIVILGRTLPGQSPFFLNYLLQDALLITPLLDLLQVRTRACGSGFYSCFVGPLVFESTRKRPKLSCFKQVRPACSNRFPLMAWAENG
jgi:hypothetical protein